MAAARDDKSTASSPGGGGGGGGSDADKWRLGEDGAIYRRARRRLPSGAVYDGEWVDGERHGRGVLTLAGGAGRYVGGFVRGQFHGLGLLELSRSQHPLSRRWRAGQTYEGEFQHGQFHGRGTLRRSPASAAAAAAAGGGEEERTEVTSYTGEFSRGRFHGRGAATYARGDVYDGQWAAGEWHGHGELRLAASGGAYVGEFARGQFHGVGRLSFGRGGGAYVGDFVRGRRHGRGAREYPAAADGDGGARRYEGEWADGEPSGAGALESAALTLVGQFAGGRAHGRGAARTAGGDAYEGEWREGLFHGRGRLRLRDGGLYDGEFSRGERHGRGRRVFAGGDAYDGEWRGDCMHGRGVLTRVAPAAYKGGGGGGGGGYRYVGTYVYDGEFDRGQQTGTARVTYSVAASGGREDGEEGEEGEGERAVEFEFPVGSRCWHRRSRVGAVVYAGGFLRGAFHGAGTLESPDGRLWRGRWVHGELLGAGERVYLPAALAALARTAAGEPPRRALGMYRVVRYEGELDRGERHGAGVATFENGDRVRGTFERGFVHGVATYEFFRPARAKAAKVSEAEAEAEAEAETGAEAGRRRERMAEFDRGRRVRWLSGEEEAAVRAELATDRAPLSPRRPAASASASPSV